MISVCHWLDKIIQLLLLLRDVQHVGTTVGGEATYPRHLFIGNEHTLFWSASITHEFTVVMTSFSKNIIPRREHRERAQPASRVAKHGLLEKKKDYKIRARHRNKNQLRLRRLREKAAFRNPDEFYYGMINSSTSEGRVDRKNDPNNGIPIANRSKEERLLAETQDKGYVGFKFGLENGKVDSMQKRLQFISAASAMPRKHIRFVDDHEELEAYDPADHDEDKDKQLEEMKVSLSVRDEKAVEKERTKAYKELEYRVDRHRKLKTVLGDMDLEKKLLDKGRRVLVRPANKETGEPAEYRWTQVRKK